MDIRKIKKLIDLIEESDIAEIEITEGEESVRISRYSAAVVPAAPVAYAAPAAIAAPAAAVAQLAAPEEKHVGHTISSPMVGTFYRSASPGSPSFTEVGQAVTAGQTLCIIEAMKLMNEIKAELSGTVIEILVQNGQTVEYDQPILKIKKG